MKQLLLFGLIALPVVGFSQSVGNSFDYRPITQTLDLALATKGSLTTVALSVNRLHGLGRSHRFRIGYGLRLTSAFWPQYRL